MIKINPIRFFFLMLFLYVRCNVFAETITTPGQAKLHGYIELTFNSSFRDRVVDLLDSRQSGYEWYLGKPFGWQTTLPQDLVFVNNQYIKLTSSNTKNYTISTATKTVDNSKWVGKAFGGGGYFEAILRFDSTKIDRKDGWPSFWALPIEHVAGLPEVYWPGQRKGFEHFIEIDVMEYLSKGAYIANIHDWYGVWNETCSNHSFCKISLPYNEACKGVPKDNNFNIYHKYGFLWVPATEDARGWVQFYFDDKPIGNKVSWVEYSEYQPTIDDMLWRFSVLDNQHLVLILGAGKNQPMEVKTVRVWQANNSSNLTQ